MIGGVGCWLSMGGGRGKGRDWPKRFGAWLSHSAAEEKGRGCLLCVRVCVCDRGETEVRDEGGGKRSVEEDERTEDKRAEGAEWIDALARGGVPPP